jgi:HSP20 family protein
MYEDQERQPDTHTNSVPGRRQAMRLTDMIPWSHTHGVSSRRGRDDFGLSTFEDRMTRMFDEFLRDVGWEPWSVTEGSRVYTPRIDVVERDEDILVSAELPGMERKDIDLTLTQNTLTLSGEKKCECEEGSKETGYYRRERSYGCFRRTVVLPTDVDTDHVEAHFAHGVLTVTLPKTPEEVESSKHIEIKGE